VLAILEQGGDWSGFGDRDAAIQAAADALIAHPGCERARGAEACVMLANDALVRELNRTYRGKDAPTNVLSFVSQNPPVADPPDDIGIDPDIDAGTAIELDDGHVPWTEPRHLGDVVLAAGTVAREAADQGIPPVHHLQHLVVHGLLHLMGFDHESDAQAEVMEGLEVEILASLGIGNPYAPLNAGEV
jgi:probable rRNA maturation factor